MIKYILSDLKKRKKILKKNIFYFLCIFIFLLAAFCFSRLIYNPILTDIVIKPKKIIKIDHGLKGELHFNNKFYQTVHSDLLISSFQNAKKSIEIAIFNLTHDGIVQSLAKAQARGVSVSLFMMPQMSELLNDALEDAGIAPVYIDSDAEKSLLHHKYSLIDRGETSQKILIGSNNYTQLQENYDPGFLFVTSDANVLQAFAEETDIFKQQIRGYEKLHNTGYKPFNCRLLYTNGFMEIWFSPGFKENSVKTRILELIHSARKSIKVSVWRMTDNDIAKALLKKALTGVHVAVIMDDYYIWSYLSPFSRPHYRKFNVELDRFEIISDFYRTLVAQKKRAAEKNVSLDKVGYFNPYLHFHTLIVDDEVVLSGTNNWTENGFYASDESTFVSNIDFWVKGFVETFDFHYQMLKKQNLKFIFDPKKQAFAILGGNSDFLGQSLAIYKETSEKDQFPVECFREEIKNPTQDFYVPPSCLSKQSLAFVFDEQNQVLASGYLP